MGDMLVDMLREAGIDGCPKCGNKRLHVTLAPVVHEVNLETGDSWPTYDSDVDELDRVRCPMCGKGILPDKEPGELKNVWVVEARHPNTGAMKFWKAFTTEQEAVAYARDFMGEIYEVDVLCDGKLRYFLGYDDDFDTWAEDAIRLDPDSEEVS